MSTTILKFEDAHGEQVEACVTEIGILLSKTEGEPAINIDIKWEDWPIIAAHIEAERKALDDNS